MKLKRTIFFIALILFAGFVIFFGQRCYVNLQEAGRQRLLYQAKKAAWQELQERVKSEISRFKGETAIIIKNLETGWEFSHDRDKLFPAASLTKVPLMAASFLAAEQGRIRLDRKIALKSSDKLTGSGSLKNMPAGVTFSVERLIGLMIYDSDNTATNIVTNLVGIDYLNKAFKGFGLKNTKLSRKIADYKLRDKGVENYTTADDMNLLLEKMYTGRLVNKNISEQCMRLLKLTRANDRIPRYLPDEITVAHKTGLERGVCHDAGIVFTNNGDFIIVALTSHSNPNSNSSKEFIARVSLLAYEYFDGA